MMIDFYYDDFGWAHPLNDDEDDYDDLSEARFVSYIDSPRAIRMTKVIWNDDAVIVFWSDKSKTVVKRMDLDEDDIYAAVAQAVMKKLYGGTGFFHRHVDSVLKDYRAPVNSIKTYSVLPSTFSKTIHEFFEKLREFSEHDGSEKSISEE